MAVNWSISERFLFIMGGYFSFDCINGAVCYSVHSLNLSFKFKENVLFDLFHNRHYHDIVNFNFPHIQPNYSFHVLCSGY